MEFLTPFFNQTEHGVLQVSAQQGSNFAKYVASDFNPIHDVDSKRFCVPGDLLFSLALNQYGLSQKMSFEFLDMVAGESALLYPELQNDGVMVQYDPSADGVKAGKNVLSISVDGERVTEAKKLENVIRQYVAFSGQNFPHILVPLMEQHDVMINPARPLIIYESMMFDLQRLSFDDLQISLNSSELQVVGKRGNAKLNFVFSDSKGEIGVGAKRLVLSGLRRFEKHTMQTLCSDYLAKAQRESQHTS